MDVWERTNKEWEREGEERKEGKKGGKEEERKEGLEKEREKVACNLVKFYWYHTSKTCVQLDKSVGYLAFIP